MLYMSGGKLATVKLIQKYSVTVRYSLYDVGTQRSTKVIYSFHNLLFRNFQVVYDILNDNRKSAWWSTCEFKLLYVCVQSKKCSQAIRVKGDHHHQSNFQFDHHNFQTSYFFRWPSFLIRAKGQTRDQHHKRERTKRIDLHHDKSKERAANFTWCDVSRASIHRYIWPWSPSKSGSMAHGSTSHILLRTFTGIPWSACRGTSQHKNMLVWYERRYLRRYEARCLGSGEGSRPNCSSIQNC